MFFKKKSTQKSTTINTEKITNYTHFLEIPLKLAGCWDWYLKPRQELQIIFNNIYICAVLFVLMSELTTLLVNLYLQWTGMMDSLKELADCMPVIVTIFVIAYFTIYREDMHDLVGFMRDNFEYYSANGLTNMTMMKSYRTAKNFAYIYTSCTFFTVTMYILPDIVSLWNKMPPENWVYTDITTSPFLGFAFIRQFIEQALLGLTFGQLGAFYASNSILLCGQLDLLCCSLRNARYTALLHQGVPHSTVAAKHEDILKDELHNYSYNDAEMTASNHHYGRMMKVHFKEKITDFGKLTVIRGVASRSKPNLDKYYIKFTIIDKPVFKMEKRNLLFSLMVSFGVDWFDKILALPIRGDVAFDIYSNAYDIATMDALRHCARICQNVNLYKEKFESFVSPLLVLRVIQVTLYLCMLLYAASVKFEVVTAEYLVAVSLDIFIYCYYGNQIILQADRVSTAAYQSAWHTMGVRPRRLLLNILLANRRPTVVRAGKYLTMNLDTFVVIIKTSFSYYTLLANVKEKQA